MFQLLGEKVIEYFLHWNHLSQKVKIIKEIGQALNIVQKPFTWVGFNEDDLEIFRPKVQEILNFE